MFIQTKTIMNVHHDTLMAMPYVQGIGCGMKWLNGAPTNEQAVLVFVEKKKSIQELTAKHSVQAVVPKSLDGIKTDVIAVGTINKHAFTGKIRPIQPGYSTGHKLVTAGTIGGFFYDGDNDVVALSNNHIFAAENRANTGDLIYQPGPIDAVDNLTFVGWPTVNTSNLPYYATLKRFTTIGSGSNLHDSAIVKINPTFLNANLINPVYPGIGQQLAGFGTATINQAVQKVGRTTGRTAGRVIALHATFTVGYDFGNATFTDCVVLTNMSAGGDSGSLILDGNMNAVALLFAGSQTVTIANPINYITSAYGLRPYNLSPPSPPPAPPPPPPSASGTIWTFKNGNGQITNNGSAFTITAPANDYCCIRRPLPSFSMITMRVNIGTDMGASWGPGMVLNYINNSLKLNIRRDGFGAFVNGSEIVIPHSIASNREYLLRIRVSGSTFIGEVVDGQSITTVFITPTRTFNTPLSMDIGKTNVSGGLSNYSSSGVSGSCIVYYPTFS